MVALPRAVAAALWTVLRVPHDGALGVRAAEWAAIADRHLGAVAALLQVALLVARLTSHTAATRDALRRIALAAAVRALAARVLVGVLARAALLRALVLAGRRRAARAAHRTAVVLVLVAPRAVAALLRAVVGVSAWVGEGAKKG